MEQNDVLFLIDAFVCINSVDKRKEWRCKEENLSRLIELHDKYGTDVVDAKTQEIRGMFNGDTSKSN
jgi:hypothetical protein